MKRFEKVVLGVVFGLIVFSLANFQSFFAQRKPVFPEVFGQVILRPMTKCSFVLLAATSLSTCTLGSEFANTELHSLKLIIPAFAATAPTATISIKDPDGSTIYSQAGIAESTTTYIPLSRPLATGSSYVFLLSTSSGTGGGTVTIDSWVYK